MTYRLIDTEIWGDPWFEELEKDEKLLFIYLFSNRHCNQVGISEASFKKISFETGIEIDKIPTILKVLSDAKKVFSEGNKYACLAFGKHQARNGNYLISLRRCLDKEPESNLKATIKQHLSKMLETPPRERERERERVKEIERERVKEIEIKEGVTVSDKSKPAKTPKICDLEFLQSLKTNPGYQGINIDEQFGRAQAWLLTPKGKGRQLTRTFFLNWLNRVDRPMQTNKTLDQQAEEYFKL